MPATEIATRTLHILLIEDNPADVELTQQCFRDCQIPHEIHAVANSDRAFAFLRRADPFAKAPRPDLILLDLNLPGIDGREILRLLKGDARWQTIPVVVLTTSDADDDVQEAYRLQASSYLRKPADLDEFVELAEVVCKYWSHCVPLPTSWRQRLSGHDSERNEALKQHSTKPAGELWQAAKETKAT